MSDPLEELFDEDPMTDEVSVQPEPEAAPEPAEEPNPAQGKGEEPAAPPAAPEEKHQAIPISALMDEREKRQAAERRAQEIERRLQEFEAKSKPRVDFYDNPEQAIAEERTNYQRALWNERLNMSEIVARQQHGDETVSAATEAFMQAAAQNPALGMDLQRQANPYGFVVNWHKQQSILAEIGNDPAAYRERLRAEIMAEQQAAAAQVAPSPTQRPATVPPRSMASAPAAGSHRAAPAASPDPLFD